MVFLFCHANISCGYSFIFHGEIRKISGPSCSKLTMSLVNDSLKFRSSDTQICQNFLLKKCE